jgi:hypothetical protein
MKTKTTKKINPERLRKIKRLKELTKKIRES